MNTQTLIYPQPRPAGLGNQCEEYTRRPTCQEYIPEDGPLLIRCKSLASRRLVLLNGSDAYTVKFCDNHYQELKAQIEAGKSLVKILGDEPCGH
jgi:hypothetical protein